jgi:hypothetical protein
MFSSSTQQFIYLCVGRSSSPTCVYDLERVASGLLDPFSSQPTAKRQDLKAICYISKSLVLYFYCTTLVMELAPHQGGWGFWPTHSSLLAPCCFTFLWRGCVILQKQINGFVFSYLLCFDIAICISSGFLLESSYCRIFSLCHDSYYHSRIERKQK